MVINCDACKTVFKIPDGIIPDRKKIRFICKKCRPPASLTEEDSTSRQIAQAGNLPLSVKQSNRPVETVTKEQVLSRIGDLPSMPRVITEIQSQMANSDINTRKICSLIEMDQALAVKVLRAANSAFYGRSGKVASINGAMNLIGLKGLMEVVSLIGAHKLLVTKLPGYGYDVEELWKHSLAVAYGSKLLALRKDPGISDTAHLAGLLHDVGRIILDKFVVDKKTEIKKFMEKEQKTFLDAETRFFGINHAKVAEEVCREWNFPSVISHAVEWHHEPSKSGNDLLAYILHMADHLATMVGIGYDSDDLLNKMEEGTMDFLGVKQTDMGNLVSSIMESVNQATQI